jgi:hypothetical protein
MMKKLFIGFVLAVLISNCFAGFSGGGRAGFSGGSRSFSSGSYSRSYSTGRSGYTRSTNKVRSYTTPRRYSHSYTNSSNHTVINNHHYSRGGYGFGGNGFFSGFLGGYLGGSLANNHQPMIVNNGGMPMGQGPLIESQPYVSNHSDIFSVFLGLLFMGILGVIAIKIIWFFMDRISSHYRNRW